MSQAQALWFQGGDRFELIPETLSASKAGWCRIETLYSGISPGTERLIYTQKVPPSLYQEMKCPYMGGEFPFPVKYGYSLVGKVIEGPEELTGQAIHVMHPHQNKCLVRSEDVYVLPAKVPQQRAILASNLETAITAIWDAQVSIGDKVLVVGFGIVGSLIARLLSFMPGVKVEVTDSNSKKLDLAERMGLFPCALERGSQDFDLAFHASGMPGGLQTAIDRVGFEGRIVESSWYGERPVSLQLGGTFHSQRKTVTSSQVSNIPTKQRGGWDIRRRKELVFTLLEEEEFDNHLTHVLSFSELPDVCRKLRQAPTEGLAYAVNYNRGNSYV